MAWWKISSVSSVPLAPRYVQILGEKVSFAAGMSAQSFSLVPVGLEPPGQGQEGAAVVGLRVWAKLELEKGDKRRGIVLQNTLTFP